MLRIPTTEMKIGRLKTLWLLLKKEEEIIELRPLLLSISNGKMVQIHNNTPKLSLKTGSLPAVPAINYLL